MNIWKEINDLVKSAKFDKEKADDILLNLKSIEANLKIKNFDNAGMSLRHIEEDIIEILEIKSKLKKIDDDINLRIKKMREFYGDKMPRGFWDQVIALKNIGNGFAHKNFNWELESIVNGGVSIIYYLVDTLNKSIFKRTKA